MKMHTPPLILLVFISPRFTQALNYNWKRSTAEENNFPAKPLGEYGELLDIQKSSIKLLYAQLSKTKAFLYSLAPEVVKWRMKDIEEDGEDDEGELKVISAQLF